ncbi:MAG: 30S ribosome-binding factor RbfA [Alistipes sp.]|nr:30S ribosome-binding factor RbfA [Alistipes sp.]
MENTNTRQQKIARQIQRDMADIFGKEAAHIVKGVMTTVTAVRISPDFSYAKIYLSIFPFDRAQPVLEAVKANNRLLRKALGQRIRNQMRIVPELEFFIDDSLEYIENIDNLLKR